MKKITLLVGFLAVCFVAVNSFTTKKVIPTFGRTPTGFIPLNEEYLCVEDDLPCLYDEDTIPVPNELPGVYVPIDPTGKN